MPIFLITGHSEAIHKAERAVIDARNISGLKRCVKWIGLSTDGEKYLIDSGWLEAIRYYLDSGKLSNMGKKHLKTKNAEFLQRLLGDEE